MLKIAQKRDQKFHFSPLRYPGGKTCLFPFLGNVIKKNKLKNVTYVEPFAGGAGAALALLFLEKVDEIVINDLDKAIYSFWKSVVDCAEEFVKKINKVEVSVREWEKQRKINRDSKSDMLELGFSTFYLNRTNVSGVLDARPIGGLDQKGKWKIDARFNKMNLSERIKKISEYRSRINVANEDGLNLIDEHLSRKNTFVYLDPPYYDKGATLYLNHYRGREHKALATKLNRNSKSYWILTYDDVEEIKELYSRRRKYEFTLPYNVQKFRRGSEVLIASDNLILA